MKMISQNLPVGEPRQTHDLERNTVQAGPGGAERKRKASVRQTSENE